MKVYARILTIIIFISPVCNVMSMADYFSRAYNALPSWNDVKKSPYTIAAFSLPVSYMLYYSKLIPDRGSMRLAANAIPPIALAALMYKQRKLYLYNRSSQWHYAVPAGVSALATLLSLRDPYNYINLLWTVAGGIAWLKEGHDDIVTRVDPGQINIRVASGQEIAEKHARRHQQEPEEERTKRENDNPTCPICRENWSKKRSIKTVCGHAYHNSCLKEWEENIQNTCPICREVNP